MTMKMTMAEFVGLEPCPFCGGEADVIDYDDECWVAHQCANGTSVETNSYATEAEAIAAWNSRADYHGYEQAAIEAWESIKAWNTRAEMSYEDARILLDELGLSERMCHPVIAITDDGGYEYALCSECDGRIEPEDNYCPNCGARVVGRDDE